MQADVVLIQAEQKLMDKADQLIVLADSSKFRASATFLVCGLDEIDIVVTDAGPARIGHRPAQGPRCRGDRRPLGAPASPPTPA